MNIRLNTNGFSIDAHFDDEAVNSLFLPLLRELTDMQRNLNRRMIVFLAAPASPGPIAAGS